MKEEERFPAIMSRENDEYKENSPLNSLETARINGPGGVEIKSCDLNG